MTTSTLTAEKVAQAAGILDEFGIDAWLTFVRETTEAGDPVLPIILGHPLTWQSALIITRTGESVAIVGKYEDAAVRSTGAWAEVVSYVESVRAPLLAQLERLDPARIAINYSTNDVKADGLTHGMYRLLDTYLDGTPFADRLTSAEAVVGALRGRKTRGEIERIRAAIALTDDVFTALAAYAEVGRTEDDIARFMRARAADAGGGLAWEPAQCPIVTTGPDSMVGHGVPSTELTVRAGNVFHVDFGVQVDAYCSDVQRSWYVAADGETAPPDDVQRIFDAVAGAIQAAADLMRPGVVGRDVDAAARSALIDAGYPEYQHATGHQVGRAAHDGGAVLGPPWERYGGTPDIPVEAGNVFTLELGVEETGGRGYLGLEEMVLVTPEGCEWLTAPQRTLPMLGHETGDARIC